MVRLVHTSPPVLPCSMLRLVLSYRSPLFLLSKLLGPWFVCVDIFRSSHALTLLRRLAKQADSNRVCGSSPVGIRTLSRVTVAGRRACTWRQHECDRCGRTYKYKDNLLRHQRFECGQEPKFSCTFCSYKAKRKTSLTYHLAARHGQKSL